jgi:hypothetical protein
MNSVIRACVVVVFLAGSIFAAVSYQSRPLVFEPRGPLAARNPRFIAHVSGLTLLFGDSGVVSEWRADADPSSSRSDIIIRPSRVRRNVAPRAIGPHTGQANYLAGPSRFWRLNVPLFEKIRYSDIYSGIDLIYYGNENRLEYDFVVAPGASWRSICLDFSGAKTMKIDGSGDLTFQNNGSWMRHHRPRAYQQLATGHREVPVRFVRAEGHQVRFDVGTYDPRFPLVIDPVLVYSSYLGGSGSDYGYSVAVDNSGCAYTVGETWSWDFPIVNPMQSFPAGNTDIFVTKWNAAGTGIVYSTYIGGGSRDVPLSIAVDAAGNAYITGFSYSTDFPVTTGALRTRFSGQSKAFVLKLNFTGDSLAYSTLLGGNGDDYATGIAVDAAGRTYISGYTASLDFPVSSDALQRSYGGGFSDGFFAKLNASGSQLMYSTYLGGLATDTAAAVALDPAGNIYLTGQTQSSNFPTSHPLQVTPDAGDGFVVKMNSSGQLVYSTYLGGRGYSAGTSIVADLAGNAYVAGYTNATDFPVTADAYQPVNHGSYDAFVATLSASGDTILHATYLGGSGSDVAAGIRLDTFGNVLITGSSASVDLPLQVPVQSTYGGAGDAFVAVFNNQLSGLYLSSYFGGAENESGAGIAADLFGNIYVTGTTSSGRSAQGIPIASGAFQSIAGGGSDVFLAKFSLAGSPLTCNVSAPAALNIPVNGTADRVGDLLLTCTGGTAGATATTDLQLIFNVTVANGTLPQLLIDNPEPASQISNVNVFGGSPTGGSTITFHGISFAVPGPSGIRTLRITNVQVNATTIPSARQVIVTVSALNSSPLLTLIQVQQTVATTGVQLQEFTLSKSAVVNGCTVPTETSTFGISDSQALLWFQVTGSATGDVVRVDWQAPTGTTYRSSTSTVGPGPGSQCFWDVMAIAGSPASLPGAWKVNAYWNDSLIVSMPFSITTVGVKQMVWQNDNTRQVNGNYYVGANMVGWSLLNPGPAGWTLTGIADMNGDGILDLIWQNDSTRQVNVNYYGGPGGTTLTSWACLNCQTDLAGWSVVAIADMDRNGVPDLIWQNNATRQVNVNYYGGPGGATMIGWACLNCSSGLAGWSVVAAADMNGDGVPDLIWQNDTTRQVNVNYYGGPGGATMIGWACLNCGSGLAGWSVVAAADMNGDGVPDLIWQNDTTRQVNVNYYGGPGGATMTGWACLNSGPTLAGWSVMGAN